MTTDDTDGHGFGEEKRNDKGFDKGCDEGGRVTRKTEIAC
jgi:hypothetical protein